MERVNAAARIQQMERAPGNPTRGRLQVPPQTASMSTAIISSLDQLQPSLLARLIRAMAEDNRFELMSVSEELVDDEH
eukprot:7222023-Prymnesium_polylepis.1